MVKGLGFKVQVFAREVEDHAKYVTSEPALLSPGARGFLHPGPTVFASFLAPLTNRSKLGIDR